MKTTNLERLYQLNTMLLTDRLPPLLKNAPSYLFTETPDNEESVLQRATKLYRASQTPWLLLIDNQGGSKPGYEGAPPWLERLDQLKVPRCKIVLIPFTEPVLHTLSEAFAMVRFAREHGGNEIIIIPPPFHLTRCFLSTITAVRHLHSELRVFCQVGVTEPWHEPALHSQKAVHGLRKDLIVHELRRIRRYQRRSKILRLMTDGFMFLKAAFLDGTLLEKLRKMRQYAKLGSPVPLCSTDEALAYLEWRDS